MALDVNKLMALRTKKENLKNPLMKSNEKQIQMFEDIEEGRKCNCPACMGNVISNLCQNKRLEKINNQD